jgi:hypothetical protein
MISDLRTVAMFVTTDLWLTPYQTLRAYEEFCLPGCNAVQPVWSQPTFGRNVPPPSSRSKNKPRKKPARRQMTSRSTCLHTVFFFVWLILRSWRWRDMFFRNVGRQWTTTWRYIPEDKTFHKTAVRTSNLKFICLALSSERAPKINKPHNCQTIIKIWS